MATAKKLPSGSWRCQAYDYTDENGKIHRKSFTCDDPSPRGKHVAEAMAAEYEAQKRSGAHSVEDITLGEAIDRYIEDRESVLSPRTILSYRSIRQNYCQKLMSKKINAITQEDIQSAINVESKTHSPKTVRNIHGVISAAFRVYRPNFAINTKLPQKVQPDLYIPSDDDIAILMRYAEGTDMELPILLAAFGPMRRGEIAALDMKDVSGNVVHVRQNMVKGTNGEWILKGPKSVAGDRYIDYPDFVAEKWQGRTGRMVRLSPSQITHHFEDILDKTSLPHFRFHDLRHYSASIQHALGIPDAYIMSRGGWSNDAVLKSVYRHAMDEQAAKMNDVANEHFESLHTKLHTK